jgi:hypothetical protein
MIKSARLIETIIVDVAVRRGLGQRVFADVLTL